MLYVEVCLFLDVPFAVHDRAFQERADRYTYILYNLYTYYPTWCTYTYIQYILYNLYTTQYDVHTHTYCTYCTIYILYQHDALYLGSVSHSVYHVQLQWVQQFNLKRTRCWSETLHAGTYCTYSDAQRIPLWPQTVTMEMEQALVRALICKVAFLLFSQSPGQERHYFLLQHTRTLQVLLTTITQTTEVTGWWWPTLYSLESHFGLVCRQVHLLSGVWGPLFYLL